MLFHHNQFVSSRRFGQRILAPGAVGCAGRPGSLLWSRALPEVAFFLFLGLVGWVLLYSL